MLDGLGARIGSTSAPETIGDVYLRTGCQPPAMTQDEVDAILAHGHRKIEAPDLLRMHSEHARAVRAAYAEGHADGSQGFAPPDWAAKAWQFSDARRRLLCIDLGRNIMNMAVICSQEAARGHPIWKVRAVRKHLVWISAGDDDALVPVASLRGILGGELA